MSPIRYRLRTLLIVTTLSATGLAGFRFWTGPSLDERLVMAANRNDPRAFEWLIWLGADVDGGHGSSGYSWTPMQEAAWSGNIAAVRLYVKHDACLDYQEKDGFTPIVYAADKSHWDIVRLLFESGADHRLEGADGLSVLDHAVADGRDDIIRLLTGKPTAKSLWTIQVKDEEPTQTDDDGLRYNAANRRHANCSCAPCDYMRKLFTSVIGKGGTHAAFRRGMDRDESCLGFTTHRGERRDRSVGIRQ